MVRDTGKGCTNKIYEAEGTPGGGTGVESQGTAGVTPLNSITHRERLEGYNLNNYMSDSAVRNCNRVYWMKNNMRNQ